jgi:hypothetical protein
MGTAGLTFAVMMIAYYFDPIGTWYEFALKVRNASSCEAGA